MKIGPYSVDAFTDLVQSFHGFPAPGVVLGGFMVDALLRRVRKDVLLDAICETNKCLPDAVQLLTPCTIGNGWLKVLNLGRFAVTLYDKSDGQGLRAFVDSSKVKAWPAINDWYYKRKRKDEQDGEQIVAEIKTAGAGICGFEWVRVRDRFLGKVNRGGMATCPVCKEGYPLQEGAVCPTCQGESPYLEEGGWGHPRLLKAGVSHQGSREVFLPGQTESIGGRRGSVALAGLRKTR